MAFLVSDAALRTGRFRFRHPALLFARVRLYPDRLELTGWHLRGPYRRRIPLRQILQADAMSQDNLLLWLSDGETVRLHLGRAPQWQAAIALQQRRLRPPDARLSTHKP